MPVIARIYFQSNKHKTLCYANDYPVHLTINGAGRDAKTDYNDKETYYYLS